MPSLQIHLFGDFLMLMNEQPLTGLHQARMQSLLAYLMLHRHTPQSRQRLAFLFWPDSSEPQARANLRRALHHIRRVLPNAEQYLQSDAKTVQWNDQSPFILDVADFEHALRKTNAAQQQGQSADVITHLTVAINLYRGEFLSGCYDDWILVERERLHQRALTALEQLMLQLEEQRDYATAIHYGKQLLILDPVHELTYRHLMRVHAANGDRAAALRVYRNCVNILQRELGVQPNTDTQESYQRLLHLDALTRTSSHKRQQSDPTHLLGREKEWHQLQEAWWVAARQRGHFALILGEPGIGKSRLLEEMRDWAAQQGVTTVHARSFEAGGGLAYGPVIDWLRTAPFQRALAQLAPIWRSEVARLLPELLAGDPDLPRPEPLTERWQRRRLFEALTQMILAVNAPLLLALDDLQWCDAETLEWLHFLLHVLGERQASGDERFQVMVIGTARSGDITAEHSLAKLLPALHHTEQVTEIELGPLSADETATLATQLVDHLPHKATLARLYQLTEGNPFFVVEMVRADLWNNDTTSLPPKVQSLIKSRLTKLSPTAHTLAGLAATIGRSFSFDVLVQASDVSEEILVQGLDELWQQRIVREQGLLIYDFSHDLIRETAYAALSPPQRLHLHRRVVKALEQIHAADLDAVCGQLGAHYEQVGDWQVAINHYRRAAHLSNALYATEQAIGYLKTVLSLLEKLPITLETQQQRVATLLQLDDALIQIEYTTTIERKQILDEAYTLSRLIKDKKQQFDVLECLGLYHSNRGAWLEIYKDAKTVVSLAEEIGEASYRCKAYARLGGVYLHRGDLPTAIAYFESYLALQEAAGMPLSANIALRSRMAEARWLCGYPQQAREMVVTAAHMIDQGGPLFNRGLARDIGLLTLHRMGDTVAVRQFTLELAELCERYGLPTLMLTFQLFRGWLLVQDGAVQAGLAEMEESIQNSKDANNYFNMPYYLSVLAQGYAQVGQFDQALATIERANRFADELGDLLWKAEILRMRGEYRLHLWQSEEEAESYYHSALDVARQQGAKSLELRAATSLARLWQQQGKSTEAHLLLAPIYSWFTEGFETPDLQAAKTLLDELGASHFRGITEED